MALQKTNPSETKAWRKLLHHYQEIKDVHLRDLFKDENRFERFNLKFKDILLDYSKNRITEETLQYLFELARECGLEEAIEKQFTGDIINETEGRAVLHTALRNRKNTAVFVNGKDVMPDINLVLHQMKTFSSKVISGEWKGFTERAITDVVNIGIGGSDLGPAMVTEALKHYKTHLNMYFVSNIDGTHISEVLKKINPETTLFIVASKTFTTQETMTNAFSARKWFLNSGGKEEDIPKHFVALSTNKKGVADFGMDVQNMFQFWDWVGGRYSLWSAIGLSIALAVSFEQFEALLEGAFEMDEHFRNEVFEENLPVILAMIGIWYNNFFETESIAILPYEQYLSQFVTYLQQGDMESNGKHTDRKGNNITYQTGPIIWGEAGTNGQHAFYQLIHQGSKLIPCDFLAAAKTLNPLGDHHLKLMSNFFAQTEALAFGRNEKEVIEELKLEGKSEQQIENLKAYKVFEGNRPSNSILYEKLTPKALGKLIVMYEHKIFVQGVIWNIFSYDQWGVELGKQLAQEILPELKSLDKTNTLDSSTNGLINTFKEMRNN